MLKMLGMIRGASAAEVLATHRSPAAQAVHAPRGRVISEVLEWMIPGLQADAFIEEWWDDERAISDWRPPVGLDGTWWLTTEHVFKTPPYDAPLGERIKVIGTAYRRHDFSTRAFFDYWRDIHAPISGRAPGLGGYVVSEVIKRLAGDAEADGFVEQWWPDRATFDLAAASPEVAIAWDDVQKYARPVGTFWVTREHLVIAPPTAGPGTLER